MATQEISHSLSNTKPISNVDEAQTKLCEFCQSEVSVKATRCRFCHAQLNKKSTEESDEFTVVREEIHDNKTNEKYTKISLVIKDAQLKQILSGYLPNNQKLYDKEPQIPADELFMIIISLRQANLSYSRQNYMGKNPIENLMGFLEKEYEIQSKRFESMKKDGLITFEALQFLFPRGMKFFGFEGEHKVGSEVSDTSYQRSLLTTFFIINGEVIKSNGDKFFSQVHQFTVAQFKGMKRIDELPVRPMDEESLVHLTERGKRFNEIAVGCHYLKYTGKILWKTAFYQTSWKADGRIMIDGTSFNKMNPNYTEFKENPHALGRMVVNHAPKHGQKSEQDIKDLPQEIWYKTWPTVGGFSFTTKKWGEVIIVNTSTIVFDDKAFERLVLPEEKKSLIYALVNHTDHCFTDIITGKGAGRIFLLHGPPGTGKTLTAEAIAEMNHKPLYSITVGELGVKPDSLEQKLGDALEVATVWDSVILIDEADIFLERRADSDVKRNAMVGIFLRLLEYHQGILFLTTNRVHLFDEAFHSRISIALKYDELDQSARKKIWDNFISISGIKGLDTDKLSEHSLNGRQIRNTIRLAQALSLSEKTDVSMTHVNRTILVSSQFEKILQPNIS